MSFCSDVAFRNAENGLFNMVTDNTDRPKYTEILEAARRLFWKYGIKKVSVEEICREAQVSKMTFYRFFPNKIEAAKAVLEQVFDASLRDYRHIMAQDVPYEEKVRQQLRLKFEGTEAISADLIRDLYSNEEWGLKAYLEQRTEETIREVVADFTHAQQQGWVRSDINPAFLLYLFHQMPAWVTNGQLLASYPHPRDLVMEVINFFFYGILEK